MTTKRARRDCEAAVVLLDSYKILTEIPGGMGNLRPMPCFER